MKDETDDCLILTQQELETAIANIRRESTITRLFGNENLWEEDVLSQVSPVPEGYSIELNYTTHEFSIIPTK